MSNICAGSSKAKSTNIHKLFANKCRPIEEIIRPYSEADGLIKLFKYLSKQYTMQLYDFYIRKEYSYKSDENNKDYTTD